MTHEVVHTIKGRVPIDKFHEFVNTHFVPKDKSIDRRPVDRFACGWCKPEWGNQKLQSCSMTLHGDGTVTVGCVYK